MKSARVWCVHSGDRGKELASRRELDGLAITYTIDFWVPKN